MNASLRIPERFDYLCSRSQLEAFSLLLKESERPNYIVLDMRDVQYIDSSALGAMILMKKKASDLSVAVALENITPPARHILEMANFDKLFC